MIPLLLVMGQAEGTVSAVGTVICLLQMIPLVGCIFPTEAALKRTFDSNGNRR